MDARVGGGYRMSFTNFGTGKNHSFGGHFTELTPGSRIGYIDTFDDPSMPGEMPVTISLRSVTCVPNRDCPGRAAGGDSGRVLPPRLTGLQLLAQLVEAEIPDGA